MGRNTTQNMQYLPLCYHHVCVFLCRYAYDVSYHCDGEMSLQNLVTYLHLSSSCGRRTGAFLAFLSLSGKKWIKKEENDIKKHLNRPAY